MTKQRSTKQALVASLLVLTLCISMLIGSTFAWFTDEVVSTGNKIQAGTLKIDLEVLGDDDATWTSIKDSKAPIFNYDKWEPGYTAVKFLKVENEGNLALKWQAQFVADAALSILADVIDVYVKDYGTTEPTTADVTALKRDLAGFTKVGTVKDFVNTIAATTNGQLVKNGDAEYLGLALKMQESAGNEYQGMDLGDFDIRIYATQLTSEEDFFDITYDHMATVDTEAELLEALAAGDNVKFELGANIVLTETVEIPAGKTVTIDLQGYTMSHNSDVDGTASSAIKNNGILTIKDTAGNGKVTYSASKPSASFGYSTSTVINNGTMTVESGIIENTTTSGASYAIDNYNTLTVKGGTIVANRNTIRQANFGNYDNTVTITGGTMGSMSSYSGLQLHVFSNAKKTKTVINGGTFNGTYAVYTSFNSAEASSNTDITINGGVFNGMGDEPSALFIYNSKEEAAPFAAQITGGTFNGEVYAYIKADGELVDLAVITGGTFSVDPSACVKDGYVATKSGDVYTVRQLGSDEVAAGTAAELSDKLSNATDGAVIVLTGDITGDVTAAQKPDVKVTIDGNGKKFAGVLTVDGKSATYTTAGLTIKNVNFVADSISADACIRLGDGTNATRYTCNVTVENCTFDVPDAVGVKSYTGGDKNLTISGCTATERAHSLAQLKGVEGVMIENCKVYSIRGINFNNSLDITVTGCTIDVQKYAVRFGESTNTTVENYEIINSTIVSDNVDGDAAIVLRAGATDANLTITNTTITAGVEMSGHENANVVKN